ncbi:MAG: YchF/TatD family DNA exonuclease [Bacteroidetes bacterium]|nr:YchF/TatD family DNA exonuclease [Bacteroidota bacterium]
MVNLIDTHSHLFVEEFDNDLDQVVNRCKTRGITKVLLPNIEQSTYNRMENLVTHYPDFFLPMIGVHPCSVKEDTIESELSFVAKKLTEQKFCAVGEIGMDLYWDVSTKDLQTYALKRQCELAIEYNLPVALHTRNATREVIDLIKKWNLPDLKGVFHCFGDGIHEALEIIDLGFYLGIGGVLTFKKSELADVITKDLLPRIILETDSPYLAPVPYRGKRNESSYLIHIAEKLAAVTQTSLEEISDITSRNARELFRIT